MALLYETAYYHSALAAGLRLGQEGHVGSLVEQAGDCALSGTNQLFAVRPSAGRRQFLLPFSVQGSTTLQVPLGPYCDERVPDGRYEDAVRLRRYNEVLGCGKDCLDRKSVV